ncbi:hypothetical protein K4H02_27850, partial [Mycobacterium tuberculosis]|nr:hypothetical protein [Mycobacterium tuberculosis]
GKTPAGGELGVMAAEALDVRGEVEGDDGGLPRDLGDERFAGLAGAQARERGVGGDGGHPRGAVERP